MTNGDWPVGERRGFYFMCSCGQTLGHTTIKCFKCGRFWRDRTEDGRIRRHRGKMTTDQLLKRYGEQIDELTGRLADVTKERDALAAQVRRLQTGETIESDYVTDRELALYEQLNGVRQLLTTVQAYALDLLRQIEVALTNTPVETTPSPRG